MVFEVIRITMPMIKNPTISVIIPAYNEERTIGSVVEVARTWEKAREVVVVNDGSTDATAKALKRFSRGVTVIHLKKNCGKGYALATGIAHSTGEALMFLDGDVVGLTHADMEAMFRPVEQDQADMVLGVARFWGIGSFEPFNELTGQRVVLRRIIADHVVPMKKVGYGVELLLNDLHKEKRVVCVRQPFVSILSKWEKHTVPDALATYSKEARDLITQLVKQTADIPPKAKGAANAVLGYLRKVSEYLQMERQHHE